MSAWWSVGGLSKQPGETHLLRGEVDTREQRHAGVSLLFVGTKASNDITLHTHHNKANLQGKSRELMKEGQKAEPNKENSLGIWISF